MKMLKSTLAVLTAAAAGRRGFAQAGATLDAVQKKGFVQWRERRSSGLLGT
jgi:general L-amino acid transport system substrate-binding protein